jgi:site-specific recombinase XerD
MVIDTVLFRLFRDYFTFYLPRMRECSGHTIRSYRKAINSLLDFVKAQQGIGLDKVTLNMITDKVVVMYLDSLKENGNSESTRALRLTCIKAFFSYAADVEPSAVHNAGRISKIEIGRAAKHKLIDHLSEAAVKVLLEQPDPATEKGLRDQFMMLLMYDTGARLQEIRSLTLRDITWGRNVSVTLHGKGGKNRAVPLMKPTVGHLGNYLKVYHPSYDNNESACNDTPLFYVVRYGRRNHISDSSVRKLIRGYGDRAKMLCPEIPDSVHPHLLRHSRAMHLYQRGMDLTLIQQWLGHAQIETTQVYAYADTEHKRKAIEKSTAMNNPLRSKDSAKRFTVTDEQTLKKLYGLE